MSIGSVLFYSLKKTQRKQKTKQAQAGKKIFNNYTKFTGFKILLLPLILDEKHVKFEGGKTATTAPLCKPVTLERFVQNVQWEPGNRNNL